MERFLFFSKQALIRIAVSATLLIVNGVQAQPVPDQQFFASPEQAVNALLEAINADNVEALMALFGSRYREQLTSGDPVEDKNNREQFAAAAAVKQRIEKQADGRAILVVGNEAWPLPIPLVQEANTWRFDTEAGIDEMLSRRIGRNELSAINVAKAYAEAQFSYASKDRDQDGVLEYAQKFLSSAGRQDGLYWESAAGGEPSPLGPLIAKARSEAYPASKTDEPQPYHGYYYKLLTRQGKDAAGGKYDYVINGNMIAGFGLLAFPAKYGSSGIMTFMINHQGKVLEKDLGPKTSQEVKAIKAFNPEGWKLAESRQ
ncbi:DUF2950 domain-containing protein [Candidatus Methylomicrobium oryzae]|uniref:DUF2950 domain-containing protein n=1 Tax=Candidatus Methylomicrobium oryzae TaxID=2802053 RepID=UPI001920C1D7|nr:DUF2950 domain-containing protein [Methylomicrobium sp. RS1]MBL1265237.1 DUF2950 domain-containing protein [Methylomicrobium sp. RS1]